MTEAKATTYPNVKVRLC